MPRSIPRETRLALLLNCLPQMAKVMEACVDRTPPEQSDYSLIGTVFAHVFQELQDYVEEHGEDEAFASAARVSERLHSAISAAQDSGDFPSMEVVDRVRETFSQEDEEE
jgi:hypothetical protein